MKSLMYVSLFLFGLVLTACFSIGSATLPSASEGYIPQKTYSKPLNDVWNAVQNVLLNERITIVTPDKENNRMQTDYVQGSTQFQLGKVLTTRYKYTIVFERKGSKSTSLNIMATLESSSKGHEWHDISKDNQEQVTKIENWFYEKIETKLASGGMQ